ncbi:hypothetical protein BGX38DRAFT_1279851 [Terfezia claveryi]|nr:hypothetical protein BGX38DRAFT_1279851 [Terfezia claveryi]
MWEVIYRARAAHHAGNPNAPAVEPRRWPLPDAQELGAPSTGPSYMPRNPRGRASAALLNAITESNAERDRRSARGAMGDPGRPAAVVPPPAALPPVPPVPPGMRRVPNLVPRASMPRQGSRAGLIAGGALARLTCRRPVPAGGAPSTAGPPTSIRIHIITPENHVADVNCGGWLFQPNTQSQTVTIHAHTMAELQLRCQPFLPLELGVVREMMLDVQVEVKPPGLVVAPAGGGAAYGVDRGRQGAGRGGPGVARGRPDAVARGGMRGRGGAGTGGGIGLGMSQPRAAPAWLGMVQRESDEDE